MYFDVRHLVYRRNALPTDAPERQELAESVRYLYPWFSDSSFRAFLFLTDCAGMIGRALGSIFVALGLNELRWKIAARLKGGY